MFSKKNILLLVSAICFLAPFFYTGYFLVKKQVLQSTVSNRFKEEKLQTIILPKNNIHWEKKGKEIRHENGLFDVQQITFVQDKAIILGWFDHKENKLQKDFSQNKTKPYFPFMMYSYYQIPVDFALEQIAPFMVQHHIQYQQHIGHTFLEVLTPPPLI